MPTKLRLYEVTVLNEQTERPWRKFLVKAVNAGGAEDRLKGANDRANKEGGVPLIPPYHSVRATVVEFVNGIAEIITARIYR